MGELGTSAGTFVPKLRRPIAGRLCVFRGSEKEGREYKKRLGTADLEDVAIHQLSRICSPNIIKILVTYTMNHRSIKLVTDNTKHSSTSELPQGGDTKVQCGCVGLLSPPKNPQQFKLANN